MLSFSVFSVVIMPPIIMCAEIIIACGEKSVLLACSLCYELHIASQQPQRVSEGKFGGSSNTNFCLKPMSMPWIKTEAAYQLVLGSDTELATVSSGACNYSKV